MNVKRIFVLTKKEFALGSRSFMFIWAIVAPIVLTFVFSMVTGAFITRTPKLGVYSAGQTELLAKALEVKAIETKEYASFEGLRNAVLDGVVDVGIVIPEGFDEALKSGTKTSIQSYVFGESYASSRAIIVTTLGNIIREMSGSELPFEVESITLGKEGAMPVKERLFPLVVLMSIFFGGLFIPSTSLIQEKRDKTIDAMSVSTSRMNEIVTAKLLTGSVVALFTGIVTLILNRAYGGYPLLLLIVLLLGVVMASFIGLLLGIYVNDFATLLSFWKMGGIVLFFPSIVYLFPKIPEIVAKFFPTYYVLQPIINLTRGGLDYGTYWTNVAIGLAIDIVLGIVAFSQVRKVEQRGFSSVTSA